MQWRKMPSRKVSSRGLPSQQMQLQAHVDQAPLPKKLGTRQCGSGFVAFVAALFAAAMLAAACSQVNESASDSTTEAVSVKATTTLQATGTSAAAVTVAPDNSSEVTTTTTTTARPVTEWTLLAGGDVLMERSESLGLDPFSQLTPSLGSADLSLINVEMTISDRGSPREKQFVFRAPPSAAQRIADGGVRVATLANNHAMDYGADALADTITLLEAAGVTTVGAGSNIDEAFSYQILPTSGGLDVAFVGASHIVPVNFAAGPTTPGIASAHTAHMPRLLNSVRTADAVADAVVVAIHWGVERNPCTIAAQRDIARLLLDAGADAIIGHHPHVLQPVVFTGEKLVAFSLGNFIWEPRQNMGGETGVLQIDFDRDRVVNWVFHPHLTDENGIPIPAESGPRVDRIRDIISGECGAYAPPPTTTTVATTTTTSLPPPTATAGS